MGRSDLVEMVSHLTPGPERSTCSSRATGSGAAFRTISSLIRKQATVLLYGHGHQGTDLSVINLLLFLEPTLVASVGASGALNPATRRSRNHDPGRRTASDRPSGRPAPHHAPLPLPGNGAGRLRRRRPGRGLHQGRPPSFLKRFQIAGGSGIRSSTCVSSSALTSGEFPSLVPEPPGQ